VTSGRIWRYGPAKDNGWQDEKVTAVCNWWGQRLRVPNEIQDVIKAIARDANLSPGQSPCLELPTEAWDEPQLLLECPKCLGRLHFNPFIVDEQDR